MCGFLGFDTKPFNPLLASMPRVLRIPGLASEGTSWIASFMRSVVEESNRKRPGGEAVLERMSEMLFVEVLRHDVDALPPDRTGWLAGMRDPAVGRALALMHEKPADNWTIDRLGEEAALSRSTLHERFVHFIGQPPMQYLAHWRMQLAAVRCATTTPRSSTSRSTLATKTKRRLRARSAAAVGESPGAWRRAHRAPRKKPTAAGS